MSALDKGTGKGGENKISKFFLKKFKTFSLKKVLFYPPIDLKIIFRIFKIIFSHQTLSLNFFDAPKSKDTFDVKNNFLKLIF